MGYRTTQCLSWLVSAVIVLSCCSCDSSGQAFDCNCSQGCEMHRDHIEANRHELPACGGCSSQRDWKAPSEHDNCANEAHTECRDGIARLYYNGELVGHCPYLPSQWSAHYQKCECGCFFIKVFFWVEDRRPITQGKFENWECGVGLTRECYAYREGKMIFEECGPEDVILQ